jgi:hypothetical protein
MSVRVLTDCSIYIGGYDFTTDTNDATVESTAEVKDKTTFGSGGWREKINGLKTVDMNHNGFWQSATASAVDPEAFTNFAGATRVCTFGVLETTPPDPCPFTDEHNAFFFQGGEFNYKLFDATVGELIPFEVATQNTGSAGEIKGHLIAPRATVTATGKIGVTFDTAGFGVPTGQFLYIAFHVFSVGTTITVQVQTDDNTGFASPTTVATLGPFTARGDQWMTPVPGPITDRYIRLNCSAITGTFSVAGALGIR